ncbi:rhodanese-like domain-containing protein [Balneolales bacterium ANBcel1]|nr:rhodanese-like domain-containing protein [Balneolales bacterium ANBcel1]
MFFRQIFDPKLAQYSYMIGCQKTGETVVIDPMRDVQQYYDIAEKEKLNITAGADTHIHADYISGLRELAERGVKVYASDEGDADWKYEWLIGSDYNYELLKDGDTFMIGNIEIRAIHTPGHTPEHLIFSVTDKGGGADKPMGVTTGDFVFVGDVGRPDLLESAAGMKDVMKPSAQTLYKSLEKFKTMPEYMQVWPGHGAGSACGKALGAVPKSTVGYEMNFNASLREASSEENFVNFILEGQPEPPLYFKQMKRDNKMGPPVLGGLPIPPKTDVSQLSGFENNREVALIDTRGREAFMNGHLKGAIFSPLDKQFNTTAGSYVTEEQPIYLVIDEENLEDAVRDLINVGLDKIEGYIPVGEYEQWLDANSAATAIPHLNFQEDGNKLFEDDSYVLDVRKASEFAEGHIEGAKNIPHTRLLERIDEVEPNGKTVYVHCSAGGRSAVAAALVQRFGHEVAYVDGDFAAWFNNNETIAG